MLARWGGAERADKRAYPRRYCKMSVHNEIDLRDGPLLSQPCALVCRTVDNLSQRLRIRAGG